MNIQMEIEEGNKFIEYEEKIKNHAANEINHTKDK